jgi:hypothetical protein
MNGAMHWTLPRKRLDTRRTRKRRRRSSSWHGQPLAGSSRPATTSQCSGLSCWRSCRRSEASYSWSVDQRMRKVRPWPPARRIEELGMVGKRRPGRFTWKDEREVIAMARNGATASEIAAKFKTTTATIERKARALGISITGGRVPKVVTRDCHPAQGSATVSCLPLKARLPSV